MTPFLFFFIDCFLHFGPFCLCVFRRGCRISDADCVGSYHRRDRFVSGVWDLWVLGSSNRFPKNRFPKNRFTDDDDVLTKVMVVERMLVAVSGLLLLMPGLVTDTFGLLLLFPAVRRAVAVVVLEIRTQRQQRRKTAKPRLALMHSLENNPLTDDLFAKEMRVCTDADMVPQYNVYGHAIWDPAISKQGRQRWQRAEARFRGRAASQALLDRVA